MAQKNGENRIEMIVSRSIELFLRKGYDETTMRMLQDATGLHSGSIYYVINGKEGILLMISEGFIGDIMCRSSRIAREMDDPRLNVLLPPAFLLYSSSASECLSRLIGQMFRTDSVMELITSMAKEWATRSIARDDVQVVSSIPFIYGGVGTLVRTGTGMRDGIETMIPFLSILMGEFDGGTIGIVEDAVLGERLPFYDMDISEIDSLYGDGLNG